MVHQKTSFSPACAHFWNQLRQLRAAPGRRPARVGGDEGRRPRAEGRAGGSGNRPSLIPRSGGPEKYPALPESGKAKFKRTRSSLRRVWEGRRDARLASRAQLLSRPELLRLRALGPAPRPLSEAARPAAAVA